MAHSGRDLPGPSPRPVFSTLDISGFCTKQGVGDLNTVLLRPSPRKAKMRPKLCVLFYVVLHTRNFNIWKKSPSIYSWLKVSKFQILFKSTRFNDQFQNQTTNSLAFFLLSNAGSVGVSNKAIFIQFSLKADCLLDLQARQTQITTTMENECIFAPDND